jgi:type IV pilus assembly protein PilV
MTMKVRPVLKQQSGVMLLEALIAILIFAVGILGIVGLQATAIKQGTDAKYRSDAAMLANQLLGTMRMGDRTPATLQSTFAGDANNQSNSGYNNWYTENVTNMLPGTANNPPAVTVDAASGMVTVQVFWLSPSEPSGTAAHSYTAVAQIKDMTN